MFSNIRSLIFKLDPETAHSLAIKSLKFNFASNILDKDKNNPIFKTIPQVNNVSVWNFYPDPDSTNINQAQYVIERHKMSRTELRSLKRRPYFRENVIEEVIEDFNSGKVVDDIISTKYIKQLVKEYYHYNDDHNKKLKQYLNSIDGRRNLNSRKTLPWCWI